MIEVAFQCCPISFRRQGQHTTFSSLSCSSLFPLLALQSNAVAQALALALSQALQQQPQQAVQASTAAGRLHHAMRQHLPGSPDVDA